MWSLSNAFTSAFKKLDPVPQFKATAKLDEFSQKYSINLAVSPSPRNHVGRLSAYGRTSSVKV